MGSQRVGHDWATYGLSDFTFTLKQRSCFLDASTHHYDERSAKVWYRASCNHTQDTVLLWKVEVSTGWASKKVWKVKGLVAQSCPTLCDPINCSPPGSSAHGILQARILEWVAVPSSRGSSPRGDRTRVSCIAADSLPSGPLGKPKKVWRGKS